MSQTTVNPATSRLTTAEAYRRHAQQVRRNAAVERQRVEVQADLARLQELYANGSLKRKQAAPAPLFKEAATRTATRLPGGLAASVAADRAAAARRGRSLDTSEESVAKRERRRQRRLARKQRQAEG
jgi:hypothetical protein